VFGNFFLYHRIAADGVDSGENKAVFLVFNFWPHQSGRVGQRHMVVDLMALLRLGDRRFIADIGHAAFEQHVHQRGFADVGDAHDHQAQRFMRAVAMRG
jgi:hypothetical protein